ncbi:MAG TPA: hypothetical protein VHV76_07800 [Mycobacteriales bacterium]|jgi:hypothetical protein|nr:hypothetical protein [Mycobacteriales bacterium]
MAIDLTGGFAEDWEFVWASQPDDPEMRESVNAWIWDNSGDIAAPRIGIEAAADQWDTHDVQVNLGLADGRVFYIYGPGAVHEPAGADGRPRILGAGPLSFELVEPYGLLKMRVEGEAVQTTVQEQMTGFLPGMGSGDRTPVRMEIDIQPAVPPWQNGTMSEEAARVLSTQEEGDMVGVPWRFEQLCRATGTITIGDDVHRLDGGANRIRRQGVRRLASFRGHSWQAGMFADGRAFGYQTFPPRPDGKPTYNEGYVFLGDGELISARVAQAPFLRTLQPGGEDVSLVLETADGTHEIRGETVTSTFMVMPPEVGGGMQLQQAVTRYSWDGRPGMGMTERSSVPEEMTP